MAFDQKLYVVIMTLKLVSLFLVVATVIPSVAHALEFPGKMRLTHEQYLVVQPIYYPGFTVIGAAEPLLILVLTVLLMLVPSGTMRFWLIAGALLATLLSQVFYWTLTAPINKVWLRDETLSRSAQRFFGASGNTNGNDWTILRDRWERSHLCRAAVSVIALLLLAVAWLT